jgi:hypothetical protein
MNCSIQCQTMKIFDIWNMVDDQLLSRRTTNTSRYLARNFLLSHQGSRLPETTICKPHVYDQHITYELKYGTKWSILQAIIHLSFWGALEVRVHAIGCGNRMRDLVFNCSHRVLRHHWRVSILHRHGRDLADIVGCCHALWVLH